jgi:hypothetical protein
LAITILENAEAINNGIIRGLYDVRNKVKWNQKAVRKI